MAEIVATKVRTTYRGTLEKDYIEFPEGAGGYITVNANAGDDTIIINGGTTHIINAGKGNDTLTVNSGERHTVDLSEGDDLVNLRQGSIRVLKTNSGTNTLNFYSGSVAKLNGGTGLDILNVKGEVTISKLVATAGTAVLKVDAGFLQSTTLGAGDDTLAVTGGYVKVINMGEGNNKISLANGKIDNLRLNSGANTLKVDSGDLIYVAGTLADMQQKGGTITRLVGGSGTDSLTISGGELKSASLAAGDDFLKVQGGSVTVASLGDGNDTLTLSSGGFINTAVLGEGEDTVSLAGGTIKRLLLSSGKNFVELKGSVTELVAGTDTDDIRLASGIVEHIKGNSGVEKLTVTGGILMKAELGAGDDEVYLQSMGRANTIYVGGGNDTVTTEGRIFLTELYLDAGTNTVNAKKGTISSIKGKNSANIITVCGASVNSLEVENQTQLTVTEGVVRTVALGAGDDELVVEGEGSINSADLGAGNNKVQLKGGSLGTLRLGKDEASVEITEGELKSLNSEGVVRLSVLGGSIISAKLSNEADVITIKDSAKIGTMYLGGGLDTLTMAGASITTLYLDQGNNDVTLAKGTINKVVAGENEDLIKITGAKVSALTGYNSVQWVEISAGEIEKLNLGGGNDRVTLAEEGTIQNAILGDGDDTVILQGGYLECLQLWNGNNLVQAEGGTITQLITGRLNDTIKLSGGTITELTGNNMAQYVEVSGGFLKLADLAGGNDTITVSGGMVEKLQLLNGSNQVLVAGGEVETVIAGTGTDTLTLTGGTIKDFVCNAYMQRVRVSGGSLQGLSLGGGFDVLEVSGEGRIETVAAGEGNDTITVKGGSIGSLSLCEGDNLLLVEAGAIDSLTVGKGRDTITINGGSISELMGNAGNQTITVTGGILQQAALEAGNDTLTVSGGRLERLDLGDGNDVLTVSGGSLGDTSFGAGNDTLTLTNTQDIGLVYLGLGNDKASLESGRGFALYGDEGEDIIDTAYLVEATLNGGADGDVLTVIRSRSCLCEAGAGDDTLILGGGDNITLIGGQGNDIYRLQALDAGCHYVVDQSSAGAEDKDVLDLSNYSYKSFGFATEGRDVILTHGNGAVITIKDWALKPFASIRFKDGERTQAEVYELLKEQTEGKNVTAQGAIIDFMQALVATQQKSTSGCLTEALEVCSEGRFTTIEAAIKEFKTVCKTQGGATLAAQKAFLLEYCGINMDNTDTGAITGWDAGGAQVKTQESVVKEPEGITLEDFVYDYDKLKKVKARDLGAWYNCYSGDAEFYAVTIRGVTFYWSEDSWYNAGISTECCKTIMAGLINCWIEGALDLIEESYGLIYGDTENMMTSSDGNPCIQITLTSSSTSGNLAAVTWGSGYDTATNRNGMLQLLNINTYYYYQTIDNINGNKGWSGLYLDRLIAHELTHAVMAALMDNSWYYLPKYIKEGAAELVHGVDDFRASTIYALANTSSDNQTTTLENIFTEAYEAYGGGYTFLRYLAKQIADYTGDNNQAITSFMESYAATPSITQVQEAALGFGEESIASSIAVATEQEHKEQGLVVGTKA